jgi:indole-3-glycerol phosphate synthase
MFLDRIVATKREEVERLKENFQLSAIEKEISSLPPCLGFGSALSANKNRGIGLIAEVKKASPSKGLIRPDFNPAEIAKEYERAGVDCISVLTDTPYFQGANRYLQDVRRAVNKPLLRKDFTIDYRQIYEARCLGADAILLIAAILATQQMKEFLAISRDLGMDTLVEVHDREELERVLELDANLLGINNRSLKTFDTDLKTTAELTEFIPSGKIIVSESGISSFDDVETVNQYGAHAILVGEHLMRQPSVADAVHILMGDQRVEKRM